MRSLVVVTVLAFAAAASAGPPVYIPPPPPPKVEKPPEPKKAERYRLLVLDLKSTDVDKATLGVLQGLVATNLAQYPELDVVSGDDLKQLVSLQAERSSMGCSEDASCLAEIADALGAKLVVFGNVGKLGDALVMNLNMFDSIKAMGLGRVVVQADDAKPASLRALPRKLRPKLRELVGKFYAEHGLKLPPVVEEKPEPVVAAAASDPGPWPWVTTITGLVLLAGGAAAAVVGVLPYQQFQDTSARVADLQSKFVKNGDAANVSAAAKLQPDLVRSHDAWNSYGYILFDAGAPIAGAGLLLTGGGLVWVLTSPSPDETAKSAAPGGAP